MPALWPSKHGKTTGHTNNNKYNHDFKNTHN